MPRIPALRRTGQKDSEFKVSLNFMGGEGEGPTYGETTVSRWIKTSVRKHKKTSQKQIHTHRNKADKGDEQQW